MLSVTSSWSHWVSQVSHDAAHITASHHISLAPGRGLHQVDVISYLYNTEGRDGLMQRRQGAALPSCQSRCQQPGVSTFAVQLSLFPLATDLSPAWEDSWHYQIPAEC